MDILHTDSVFRVDPNTSPDYDRGNSLRALLALLARAELAAGREHYYASELQYLFPFEFLDLYGPAGADSEILDPRIQDNKEDFQKQNVRAFRTTDTMLIRGWAAAGEQRVPFLRLSYRGGPDSLLSQESGHRLGSHIQLWLQVGQRSTTQLIRVPYNERSDRYEIELWGDSGGGLRDRLDPKGREALDRGELVARSDLVPGTAADFAREALTGRLVPEVAPDHAMHPILPLRVELAWTDERAEFWDSKEGANYVYEFSMILRGWDSYLGVGISPNPHGGVGFLEFRNLLSNYFGYKARPELQRQVMPWSFDANGQKPTAPVVEPFMAVDYMDLHVLKPSCGIGIHRHRDNQEVFFMLEGRGFMVIGDWVKFPTRERCFEIRTLRSGHFAMLKGGQLHGLMNPSDEDLSLFMFGGYD
ncbi:MAG: cupin domain-containing protein [Myxococcota bacterium]|nr:cupin domain-containing protein [Myxococcota bacterium]